MITKLIQHVKRTLRVLALACGGFAAAGTVLTLTFTTATAQTLVQSTTEQVPGAVRVVFPTTAGKSYRIQHSSDLQSWAYFPESIYGFGQTVRYHVYDAPTAQAAAPLPPSTEPRPSEYYFFIVTAFPDGSAVASWQGKDGSPQKAYIASFDLRYLGQTMQEMIDGTRVPASPALPFRLSVWSWSSPKDPAVVNIVPSPTETATLAKLTSQYTWTSDTMKARVDYRAANPGPPPSPPKLFDDRGQPVNQYFRVYESNVDSNFDGTADYLQFGNGGNPFNMDNDGDGIPNGYDSTLFPNETALNNVLINEILYANEFTNADEDGQAQDWVELYNPTNAAVDVSGWFLGDRTTDRFRWAIPAGTPAIPKNGFLVVWCSKKSRGVVGSAYHTNFELKNGNPETGGGTPNSVYLSKADQTLVDSYVAATAPTSNLAPIPIDVSYGRYPSATGLKFGFFILPTPGASLGSGRFAGAHNVVGALGMTDKPVFSGAESGLYEATSLTAMIAPPATGGAVHITTNCVHPTRYSELYSGPITFDRTKIIRAVAAKDGYLPSAPVTRTFHFKEDILGTAPAGTAPTDAQGARDASNQFKGLARGYPEATNLTAFPIRYEMNPAIIATRRAEISAALSAAPILSLVSTVPELLDVSSGGLYANAQFTDTYWYNLQNDPIGKAWQRLCHIGVIPNGQGGAGAPVVELNACLSMTGGSSLTQEVTRKHNMRIKFTSLHGPSKLNYPGLFPDTAVPRWDNLHLKNLTHDSWSQNMGGATPFGTTQNWINRTDEASYCNEAWIQRAHVLMGHDGPRHKWVNVFINGLYWGPYELTERIDADFMKEHVGDQQLGYEVLKQNPNYAYGVEAVDGEGSEVRDALGYIAAPAPFTTGSALRAFVPLTAPAFNYNWVQPAFDDSAWTAGTTGVGFDTTGLTPAYTPQFGLNLDTAMRTKNNSCFVRVPFNVVDPEKLAELTLGLKYDDGVAIWLNGTYVYGSGAPSPTISWNSSSTAERSRTSALTSLSLNLLSVRSLLLAGNNVLAFQGLNHTTSPNDFLLTPTLTARLYSSGTAAWASLVNRSIALSASVTAAEPAATQASKYDQVLALINVDNYVDYLLSYAYAHGQDWPQNNFRLARSKAPGGKFVFYVWDAEWAFEQSRLTQSAANMLAIQAGVTLPHFYLRNYSGYRQKFSDRIKLHFLNAGPLAVVGSTDRAVTVFQDQMARVQPLLWAESARWGSLRVGLPLGPKATPYQPTEPSYLSGDNWRGDWSRVTSYRTGTWFPTRRTNFISSMQAAGLYIP
jgi:Lamin Tail Domain/CotH kinase protein/Chitobiase/beta-hexosaminidase C-terminal domain